MAFFESLEGKIRMKRVEATFFGEVQGVNMRVFCRRVAQSLEITGAVWNDPQDVSKVHLIAEGAKGKLETFLREVQNYEWSKVNEIAAVWKRATREFTEFKITMMWKQ